MYKKQVLAFLGIFLGLIINVAPAFAHAIVKPDTAGIGSYTDFSLGVPSEKDGVSTTSVQLTLPAGLESISPIVKGGWQVQIKNGPVPSEIKLAPDDDGNVPTEMPVEIDWIGGSIPSGQKDYFVFTAQVPSTPTELDWKVVQTYSDGSTISWTIGPNDTQPKDENGKPDYSKFGPYSKTMVVNDLTASPDFGMGMTNSTSAVSSNISASNVPLMFGIAGTALGALSLAMQLKKGKS